MSRPFAAAVLIALAWPAFVVAGPPGHPPPKPSAAIELCRAAVDHALRTQMPIHYGPPSVETSRRAYTVCRTVRVDKSLSLKATCEVTFIRRTGSLRVRSLRLAPLSTSPPGLKGH